MRNWSEISGYAASQNKYILIKLPYTKGNSSKEEHTYYYECTEEHFKTLGNDSKTAFRDEKILYFFARYKAKDSGLYYNLNKKHWGWTFARRTGGKRAYSYYLVDLKQLRGLQHTKAPHAFPFDLNAYLNDEYSFTGTKEPKQFEEAGNTNITTFFTTASGKGTETVTTPEENPANEPQIETVDLTIPDMNPDDIQTDPLGAIMRTLGNLDSERLRNIATALTTGNPAQERQAHTQSRANSPLGCSTTAILSSSEKTRAYGKLLSDRDALEHSMLKNLDSLDAGRPPILPRGCVVQTPSPHILTPELADKMDKIMMECAIKLSKLLINAQQEELNILEAKITSTESHNNLTNTEKEAANKMMLRNREFLPRPKQFAHSNAQIQFFKPPIPGTNQIRFAPGDQPFHIHSTLGSRTPRKTHTDEYSDHYTNYRPYRGTRRGRHRRRNDSRQRQHTYHREESESDENAPRRGHHTPRKVHFDTDEEGHHEYPRYNRSRSKN